MPASTSTRAAARRDAPARAALWTAQRAALLWLVVVNIVLAVANGYRYIPASGVRPWSLAWLYAHVALCAQLAAATLLIGLALLAIAGLGRAPRGVAALAAMLFSLLQLAIAIDVRVYMLFRYHLNGLVLGIVGTPAGWQAMQIAPREIALVLGTTLALAICQYAAFRALARRLGDRSSAFGTRRAWLAAAAVVALLTAADHVAYAVSDVLNLQEITASATLVPLYQPLTLRKLARRYGVPIDRPVKIAATSASATLRYPRAPLRYHDPVARPNIVWLVVESWRRDTFNAENTPAIWRFGERAQIFRRHMSGGNGTRFGIFSMFYGLHGSYWERVRTEHPGPVLLRRLQDLGYAIQILSSTPLDYADLRRGVFADVAGDIEDQLPGSVVERDRGLASRLDARVADVHGRQPFFSFLFFDATHSPYDFPPEDTRYRPSADTFLYQEVAPERRTELFNRYRNAVAFLDEVVGGILERLEARGALSDTIVLITGDHGEECYEHGYWGHGAAFTPEQLDVPLVLYVPGRDPAVHDGVTMHQDLAPTFLEMLGIENVSTDYSLGRSLFADAPDRFAVSCGWAECALIDGTGTVVFGTEPYNANRIAVRDRDYRPVADSATLLHRRAPELVKLMTEMSTFLR